MSEGQGVFSPQFGQVAYNPKLTDVERLSQGVDRLQGAGDMAGASTLQSQLSAAGWSNIQRDPATGRMVGMKDGQMQYVENVPEPYVGRPQLPSGMQYGAQGPEYIPEYLAGQETIRRAGKPEQNIQVDARNYEKTDSQERAKMVNLRQEGAMKAQDFAGSVRVLADVMEGYSGGPLTQFQSKIGQFFPESEYGKITSMDEMVNSIRTKMAPMVRATGSGATSDYEMKMYLSAIPSLATTPQGRQMMADLAERIAERELIASDVYSELAQQGPVKLTEWRKRVREQVGGLFNKDEVSIMRGKNTKVPEGWSIQKVE